MTARPAPGRLAGPMQTAQPAPSRYAGRSDPLLDSAFWTAFAWAGVVAAFAGTALLAAGGRLEEFVMAAAFAAPLLIVVLVPHNLPPLLSAILVACGLVSGAGWALDWYDAHWWFDIVTHFINPFALVAASMIMFWKAGIVRLPPLGGRFVLWASAYGLALGVLWELIEVTYLVLTVPDTILDIVMDVAGAALGGWFAGWIIVRRGWPPAPPPDWMPGWLRRAGTP